MEHNRSEKLFSLYIRTDEHLLRTSLEEDGEGFFIALFTRKADQQKSQELSENQEGAASAETSYSKPPSEKKMKKVPVSYFFTNSFRMFLYSSALKKRKSHKK